MSKHETTIRLRHKLDYAREAHALVQNKSREELDRDRLLELALIRLVEMIGEAASRVPSEERVNYPEIPWPPIVNMRNRLIHGYDEVDKTILWETITDDLPALIVALEKILSEGNQHQ